MHNANKRTTHTFWSESIASYIFFFDVIYIINTLQGDIQNSICQEREKDSGFLTLWYVRICLEGLCRHVTCKASCEPTGWSLSDPQRESSSQKYHILTYKEKCINLCGEWICANSIILKKRVNWTSVVIMCGIRRIIWRSTISNPSLCVLF